VSLLFGWESSWTCYFVYTVRSWCVILSYSAHVYDVLRAQLPTLELDAVFEAKEELALAVKQALAETMTVRAAAFATQTDCSMLFGCDTTHTLF
jgi:hypothetical protein